MITPANINVGPTNTASRGNCALSMQADQNSSSPVQTMIWGQRCRIQSLTLILSV
jgi:hypothetical protein